MTTLSITIKNATPSSTALDTVMLSVASKPVILSIVKLNVIMLNVVAPKIVPSMLLASLPYIRRVLNEFLHVKKILLY